MNEQILIIEDDEAIMKVLQRTLNYEGYRVEMATDGPTGLNKARAQRPDLVILDLGLPGMDGFEVCQRLRKIDNFPVLILTARSATQDRVTGLDAGADDYLVKPVELEELLARIRALFRRVKKDHAVVLKFGDLTLDTNSHQATRGKRVVDLTAKEFDLLELFMRHPRQVLTRELIFDRVWGYDFGGESNVLDVYIRYLRAKLEKEMDGKIIQTVRGVGYVLRENI